MNVCAWCEKEAVGEVELEPAKRGKDKRTGTMVVKKPPKMAFVCSTHRTIIDEQPPFYTCGCPFIEEELKCPRHGSMLRHPWREKHSTPTIKHSNVERIVIKP